MDKFDSIRNDKELSDVYQMGLKSIFDKTQNIRGDFQGVADFNKYMDQQVNDLRGIGDVGGDSERFGYMAAYKVKKAVMDRIEKSNVFPTKDKVQAYIYEEAQALVSERKIAMSTSGFSPLALDGAYVQDTERLRSTPTIMEHAPELIHSEAFADGGASVTARINSKVNEMIRIVNEFGGNELVSDLSPANAKIPANSKYKLYPLENEDGTFDYQIVHIGKNTFDPVLLRDEAGDPLVITVDEFGQIADSLNNE